MSIDAVDLFSGPGGLTLGMKMAGIHPVMGVEFNRDACSTYRMHTDSDHREADVRTVDFTHLRGRIGVVYGGPPCQPFSLGGLRKGMHDPRDMVPEFIRAVQEIQPDAFLMENVPGLLSAKYREYFESIVEELSDLGFTCAYRIVDASDYGVPQKRRRVIVVGLRGDQRFRFPAPTHGDAPLLPKVRSSSILGVEPIGEPANAPVMYAPVVDLRPNPYHGHVFKGGGRPIDPLAPCQTIYASAGGNKTHWVDTLGIVPEYHQHLKSGGAPREGQVEGARRLSVEESALIQTFPDGMPFAGSRSSQYRQVGDAVPPLLGKALGAALVAHLNGDDLSAFLENATEQPRLALK